MSAGKYAGRLLEAHNKELGINWGSRKILNKITAPFLESKPPVGTTGIPLWQGIRNDTARTIKRMRTLNPEQYRRLRGFSEHLDDVIQFAGGYVNTPEGIKKETGIGAHINRNAGKYIGGVGFTPVVGLPIGFFVDRARRHHNLIKTKQEPDAPWLSQGEALSARLDNLIEFSGIMNPEMVGQIFGRGSSFRNLRKVAGGVEHVAPGVAAPGVMNASMATGGVKGATPLGNLAAARTGINPGVAAPPTGFYKPMATGAPPAGKQAQVWAGPKQSLTAYPEGSFGAWQQKRQWLKQGRSIPTGPATPAATAAATAPAGAPAVTPPKGVVPPTATAGTSPEASPDAASRFSPWLRKNAMPLGIGVAGGLGAGLALDYQHYNAVLDRLITFASQTADTRERNQWGQFSQQEGGPDPNAMVRTYQMLPPKPQLSGAGIGTVAATAAVGSAAGATAGLGVKYTADKIMRLRRMKLRK